MKFPLKASLCNLLWLCVFLALAMEFHEKLQSLAAKEGLRGRKVNRALESFSWNITILKVSNTRSYKNNTNSLRGRPREHVFGFRLVAHLFALV